MYCTNCGKQLADTARFCTYCGQGMRPDGEMATQQMDYPAPNARGKRVGILIIAIIVSAALVIGAVGVPLAIHANKVARYADAQALLSAGNYARAQRVFLDLGGFEDSKAQADACRQALDYQGALALKNSGDYQQAMGIFASLGEYEDSPVLFEQCRLQIEYDRALSLMRAGEYAGAADAFLALGDFEDALM